MVLCLLIYSYAEWKLRRKLKEAGQSVPNQLKKPTQKPTMRWIFQIFIRVTLIIGFLAVLSGFEVRFNNIIS